MQQSPLSSLERNGEYAVLIGAMEGVGRSSAFELAKRGMNLVIIDNDIKELYALSEEIKSTYGVKCIFINADFIEDDSVYQIISEKLSNKDVSLLINFSDIIGKQSCLFLNETNENIQKMIAINMASVLNMIRIVLPEMLRMKKGTIIHVTRLTATTPTSYLSLYSSLKGFVLHLTEALDMEYEDLKKPLCFETIFSLDRNSDSNELFNYLRSKAVGKAN
ncbi:hydroxysteroid dehydrogenase-like protein 1 [Centruroides vittatus]|uniref:hydroxysteroid dehydrogenase-like protein 1 n=1 Tax=Centruroides vittatus TaxID=120091 RepID=UPI00350EF6E9